ncbi:MAG TPA: fumarylacetoacetase [Actinomycetota bacterium]|jgi:fumarylacetoacetase
MNDATTDPALRSWVPVAGDSDFPIQNLPYGVFRTEDQPVRPGVAIGHHVLDLALVADLVPDVPPPVLRAPTLNPLLARGRAAWRAVRARLSELLREGNQEMHRAGLAGRALVPMEDAEMQLPFAVGDVVDFYSSLEHATNLGRMFRPDQDPLLPNWRHLPVGYHGRSGTVVVSGTPIHRPRGHVQRGDAPLAFEPTSRLDIELEVGFVTGPGNDLGRPIPVAGARDHIFGLVLVNDWSARDIQRFEYQPLGPFLGKSFATTVSPWVVTLDALEPFRVAGPEQDPEPLPHLRAPEPRALDVHLEVDLSPAEEAPTTVSRTNLRGLYWSVDQQLAHATSNGATARPGDLFASGTISGPDPGTEGSLIELTRDGPLTLADGSTRTFLEDGDEVILRGWAGGQDRPRVGFGECMGRILPAT